MATKNNNKEKRQRRTGDAAATEQELQPAEQPVAPNNTYSSKKRHSIVLTETSKIGGSVPLSIDSDGDDLFKAQQG